MKSDRRKQAHRSEFKASCCFWPDQESQQNLFSAISERETHTVPFCYSAPTQACFSSQPSECPRAPGSVGLCQEYKQQGQCREVGREPQPVSSLFSGQCNQGTSYPSCPFFMGRSGRGYILELAYLSLIVSNRVWARGLMGSGCSQAVCLLEGCILI